MADRTEPRDRSAAISDQSRSVPGIGGIREPLPLKTVDKVTSVEVNGAALCAFRGTVILNTAITALVVRRGAALTTHAVEATRRPRRFTFGRYVFLRCHQLEAADLLEHHPTELVEA